VIAWLTRKFSRDPGQLGLFELAATATPTRPMREPPPHSHRMPEAVGPVAVPLPHRIPEAEVGAVARPTVAHGSPTTREASGDALQRCIDPDAVLHALRTHGLRGVDRVVLTRNRRTMVSLAGGVLRVHEGFAAAPPDVHAAIAIFATSRNRAKRNAARDIIVAYPVPVAPAARRPAAQHPDDAPMAARLTLLHAQLNLEHFGGRLDALEILVSRRLARRLGHYTLRAHAGGRGEIVISRRHVRRDGWPEAIHTLLHEMVHQWQDETGRPVDHGRGFRAKCRAVGIEPAATRMLPR
jgi:hypothetical protein